MKEPDCRPNGGTMMDTDRLEAFSDGVLAIIITIMVLELKVPHGASLPELWPLLPVFLSYVLSFVYLGIYWNNHHHMLHGMGENNFAPASYAGDWVTRSIRRRGEPAFR
jgi:uncharacterized membrane protein